MVPRDITAPRTRYRRLLRRRRQIFERLLMAAGITLLLGLIPPLRWLLAAHLAVDVVLAVYIARLIRWKREETPRARPSRPARRTHHEDVPARAAGGEWA